MSLNTTFLSEKFEFSDDLIKYLDILELTTTAHSELCDYFVKKIVDKGRDTVYMDDMLPELRRQAGKYIALLCQNGVYTRTIEECMTQSQGYDLVNSTIDAAVAEILNIVSDEISEYLSGLERSRAEAKSKVTGSGIRVWSSSFTTLAAYATADHLSTMRQLKKAQSEFQTQMSRIEDDAHDRSQQREAQYIKDIYLPNMFHALGIFVFSMMENCLSDMIEAGTFDSSVLQHVDINKSEELLKNLSLSNNVKAVLLSAYEACPFNIQVYVKCATRGLFTNDMLSFLGCIGKKEAFESEIKKLYGKILSKGKECTPNNFVTLLKSAKALTEVLSLISNKPIEFYYQHLGSTVHHNIVNQYDKLKKHIQDETSRYQWYDKFTDDDILDMTAEQVKAIVRAEVFEIATDDVFSALMDICKYSALLTEISHNDMPKAEMSKSSIDAYYAEHCAELIASCLLNAKQSVKETKAAQKAVALKNKATKEQGEKKKKRLKPLIIFVLVLIYLIPITVHLVKAALYESAVREEITAIITTNLHKQRADSDSYVSKIELQTKFTIDSIEFYKPTGSQGIYFIVPNVTFYSNTSDTWGSTGRLAVSDIIDGVSTIDTPSRSYWGSPQIEGNAIIIEADGNKLNASWFDNYNDSGRYEKANIYITGSWICWYIIFAGVLFITYKIVLIQVHKKIDENTLQQMSDECGQNRQKSE